jgi:hypothetical protein
MTPLRLNSSRIRRSLWNGRFPKPKSDILESPSAAWYRYSKTREGAHPKRHLRQFRGVLKADGFGGFNTLYESGAIREAACWAHARRKFYELHEATKSPLAGEALDRIRALYAIEERIRGRPPWNAFWMSSPLLLTGAW